MFGWWWKGCCSVSTTTNSSATSTTTRYYEDTSDSPAWATTTTGGLTETSRYLSSIAGDLSFTKNMTTGFLSVGIIDPQGSVVATTYAQTIPADGEAGTPEQTLTAWSGLESFDEYGNKLTNAQNKSTGALNYAWLGGKERATDTTGLVLMGVRLYNSVTGHFTSVDPVKGGNTTAYSYPQDSINKYDLDGKAWGWAKKLARFTAVVSIIPGPIGMIATGISVTANLALGNWKEAGVAAIGFIPGAKLAGKITHVSKTAQKFVGWQAKNKYIGFKSKAFGRGSVLNTIMNQNKLRNGIRLG